MLLDTEVSGKEEGHEKSADHEGRNVIGRVNREDPVAEDVQQENNRLGLKIDVSLTS